jgi:sugar O-acyltransferase (sialic acid O-acetyltransferase NeuD family)
LSRRSIILIGGGGHCRSTIDLIASTGLFEIRGIVDIREKVGEQVLGIPIIGTDDDLDSLVKRADCFAITLGHIADHRPRQRYHDLLLSMGAEIPTIISPHAYIAATAQVGAGTQVFHQVLVNAAATIGKNCILNNQCAIEHDVQLGSHIHVSVAAVLNGQVSVGNGSFVGSNATVKQSVRIGERAIIGAGAVVLSDVGADETWAGVPAKKIK